MSFDDPTRATWSDSALADFEAVVASSPARERLRGAIAEALVAGWDRQRDKPAWALCLLLDALGRTGHPPASAGAVALEPPEALLATLGREGAPLLEGPGGRYRLTRRRLVVLQAYLEFALCAASPDDVDAATAMFEGLDGLLAGSGDVTGQTRALARAMHAYRSCHYVDGHATNAYLQVGAFLAETCAEAGEVGDDDVLAFWLRRVRSGERDTYRRAYLAVRRYLEDLALVRARRAARRSRESGGAGDARLESVRLGPDGEWIDDAPDHAAPALSALDAAEAMAESAFRPLANDAQRALLTRLAEVDGLGRALPLATLRLLSFHPVQSVLVALSRKTGSAEETAAAARCDGAEGYEAVCAELDRVRGRLVEQMRLTLTYTGRGPEEVRAEGVVLLRRAERRRAFDRPREEVEAALMGDVAPLVVASELLSGFLAVARPRAAAPEGDALMARDRPRFAAAFHELYATNR